MRVDGGGVDVIGVVPGLLEVPLRVVGSPEGLYEGPLRRFEDLFGAGVGGDSVGDALGDRLEDRRWVI